MGGRGNTMPRHIMASFEETSTPRSLAGTISAIYMGPAWVAIPQPNPKKGGNAYEDE